VPLQRGRGVRLLLAFWRSLLAHARYPGDPQPPRGWEAVSTHFGGISHRATNPLAEYTAAETIQQRALASDARVIVFPESVVADWTPATDMLWQQSLATLRARGETMLVGAVIPQAQRFDFAAEIAALNGTPVLATSLPRATAPSYRNAVVIRGAQAGEFL
jgi:predicted amidohydrolase